MLSLVSCTEQIVGPEIRDTIVVIDTGHPFIRVTGMVRLRDTCVDRGVRGGVEVRIPSLGLVTLTDDSGNYSFDRLPTRRLDVVFSHQGFFTYEASLPPQSQVDGSFTFTTISLHAYHDLTGDFDGDAVYQWETIAIYKDTIAVGPDGELYKRKVFVDSTITTTITFPVKALDAQGARTSSARPMLFVSRQKEIDPRDSFTFVFALTEAQASDFMLNEQVARKYGLKKSEPIFVAVSSYPTCMSQPRGGRCGASWGVQSP